VAAATAAIAPVTPAPAVAAVGDTWNSGDRAQFHHEVLYDSGVHWNASPGIRATCPTGFPYLDAGSGSDGRHVGRGIRVNEPGGFGVSVTEIGYMRSFVVGPDGKTHVHGVYLEVDNHIPFTELHIAIERVCTNDLSRAWDGS
jgi:hypothetical protein